MKNGGGIKLFTGQFNESLLNLFQRCFIVFRQLYPLPHSGRLVGPFNGLHVQVQYACDNSNEVTVAGRELFTVVLSNCGISAVGKWARLLCTQPSHVVFISAECVCPRSESHDQINVFDSNVCHAYLVLKEQKPFLIRVHTTCQIATLIPSSYRLLSFSLTSSLCMVTFYSTWVNCASKRVISDVIAFNNSV